jgi:hypothetical protein
MSIKSKVFAATATLTLAGGLSVAGLLPANAATFGGGGGDSHSMSSQQHGRSDISPCNSQGGNRQGENRQGEKGRSSYQEVQYQQQSYGGAFYRGRQGQEGGEQLHGLRYSPC